MLMNGVILYQALVNTEVPYQMSNELSIFHDLSFSYNVYIMEYMQE